VAPIKHAEDLRSYSDVDIVDIGEGLARLNPPDPIQERLLANEMWRREMQVARGVGLATVYLAAVAAVVAVEAIALPLLIVGGWFGWTTGGGLFIVVGGAVFFGLRTYLRLVNPAKTSPR
jgi:hypothetical protein